MLHLKSRFGAYFLHKLFKHCSIFKVHPLPCGSLFRIPQPNPKVKKKFSNSFIFVRLIEIPRPFLKALG